MNSKARTGGWKAPANNCGESADIYFAITAPLLLQGLRTQRAEIEPRLANVTPPLHRINQIHQQELLISIKNPSH
jgi:hypothetical protein